MTAMSALTDSFSVNDLATVWGNSFNSPVINGGRAALPCIAAYSGIGSTSNYDLTGSYAFIKAVPYTPLTTGQTLLRLQASTGNWIQIGFDGGNTAAAISQGGVTTQGTAVPYNAISHACWRIREAAGTLYCDTSPDAVTWTNLWSTSHSFAITAMQAQVLSGHYGGTSGTLINLQNVNSGPYVIQCNEYDSAATLDVGYTTGSPYGFSVTASSVNNTHPGSPAAYPSIYVGNQWGNLSQGNPFPLPVSGISAGQVVTTCAATLGAGGSDIWDYVFDNWFNEYPTSSNNAVNGLEHMIWMNNSTGVVPPGTLYASGVTLGANTFNIYWQGSWANASQGTASFQFTTGVTGATIDMADHIAYMVAQGWLPSSWYLINVQAGFELWKGGSGLDLTSFTVSDADGTSYVEDFNIVPGSTAVPFPSSILDLTCQLQLPQAASLPPLGVYRGPLGIRKQDGVAGTAGQGIAAYETFIGRSVTYALDYLWNVPNSTAKFTGGELAASNNANTDAGTAASGWTGNLGGRTLMLAIPACIGTSAGAGATTWAGESAGTSDTYWTALGNNLISWGLGSSVLRIGREFNGNWYGWSPSVTGDTAAQYIAGYRHIVTLLRGLTGAHFTFQWNPILDPAATLLSSIFSYYPGSAYVDSIGIDSYDWNDYTTISSPYARSLAERQANWTYNYTNTVGILQWLQFAQAYGKPLGFPEWGLQLWLTGGSYIGGGDNPYDIDQMAEVFAGLGSQCAVSALWEDDGMGVFDTDGYAGRTSGLTVPESRAAFLALYGPGATAEAAGWTDITSYVYQRSEPAVTITRGRPDEATSVSPASADMEWNNRDGRFSPENTAGAFYPDLTRNTPVRLSVPDSGTYLRFADDSLSWAAGVPATEITGDIDVRLDLALDSYTDSILASKYSPGPGSWVLFLNGDGTLQFEFWDASNGVHTRATAVPIPLGRIAVRATMQVSSGGNHIYTWYTAPSIGSTWTQLDQYTATGTTSIQASPGVAIAVGDNPAWRASAEPSSPLGYYGLQGKVYGLQVLSGVGGTATASPDFTSLAAGTTSWTDAAGTAWALYGTAEISGRSYRFHGECSSLPQKWDVTGTDVYVPVQAGGLVRRKSQGNKPLDSAMYRAYVRFTGALTPVAYWPCEDGQGSTQIASGLSGGQAMAISGSPGFASNSSFLCSNSLPTFSSSTWKGTVPPYTGGTDIIVRFLLSVPSGGDTDTARIVRVYTTGTVNEFSAYYGSGGGGEMGLIGYSASGATLFDTTLGTFGLNGGLFRVSMELRKSGANIAYSIVAVKVGANTGNALSGTLTTATVGQCTQVWGNPYANLSGTAVGHISVQSTWDTLFDLSSPLNAWQGEAAGYRFARLCSEEGLNSRIYGFPAVTVPMGPQTPQTLPQLLQECETADGGLTYEPRETLGIAYRTLASMCNQSPAVTLTYTSAQLADPLEPTEDDQLLRNDVTVTQASSGTSGSGSTGSSARAVLTSGPLSVNEPPNGSGRYDTQVTVNAAGQLDSQAGWMLHMGTVNQPRFPLIRVSMARSQVSGLFYTLQDAVDVGAFVDIASPPAWLPPGDIKQIVSGVTERLGGYTYELAWNCAPELPYEVAAVATGSSASDTRADTDASALYAPVTTTATSLQVMTLAANANYPLWTTAAADFPFDIAINGERITVTNITGTTSPQTFTVTRSVNGVVLAHQAGEDVRLFTAPIVALI